MACRLSKTPQELVYYEDIEPAANPNKGAPLRTHADDMVNVSFICDSFFHDNLLKLIYFLLQNSQV